MNKIQKQGRAVLYGDPAKYQTYETPGSETQIRDNQPAKPPIARGSYQGIVLTLSTLGGRYATWQSPKEAKHLARKIVRLLNA